jgi:alpha-tubulin suppressor-like RCC1 family protein
MASGTAYCWGANESGQLGNGATTASPTPVPVSGLSVAAISAGGGYTCGLTASGTAYCWGNNSRGDLGNGTTTGSATPVPVSGGLSFAGISAGGGYGGHTCGLTTGGVAYCWGWNSNGQLGDGTQANRLVPVKVVGQP